MDALIQYLSDMTLGELCKYAALLIGGITCFVEFSNKIKWNPLTAILNWLGERINGPLETKIAEMGENYVRMDRKIDTLRDTQDDNEIDRIRWEIIEFARSCRNKEKHTLDAFTHVIDLYGKYHRILERRDLKNGQIDLEYQYIIEVYKKCQMENSFL